MFVRFLMVAVHASLGPEPVQFVVLFQCDETDSELSYSITSPYREPLSWLGDHIGARDLESEAVTRVAGPILDAELELHMALPDGQMVPLVVDYNPAEDSFGYYNLNHLRDPGQFLNPYLCSTTSGFLNYLGATLIENAPGTTKTVRWDNLSSLHGKGVDEWFRWFYCYLDTSVIFDPDRLFVSATSPESWRFDYRGGVEANL
jgi:hypothetical protein